MTHDAHDLGLAHDLASILSRRKVLALFGASAAVAAGGCDRLPFLSRAEAEVAAKGPDGLQCVVHPAETAGPFPADGSNRAHGTLANVLRESGIVRRDMRNNLGGGGVADGIELTLTAYLVSVGQSCTPLAGHAIYLWHCDAEGRYSVYDLEQASYLRAVAVTDAQGKAEFVTIVPGCYMGRYPHMHFEVYPSLETATDYRNRLLTSQLAIPEQACNDVYSRHAAYAASIANFARSPLDRDGIFRDNTPGQLKAQTPEMRKLDSGSYEATVTIGLKSAAS